MFKLRLLMIIFINIPIINVISSILNQQNSCVRIDSCLKDDETSKIAYKNDKFYEDRNCYCDDQCKFYDDCCENFEEKKEIILRKINFTCNLQRAIFDKNNFVYSIGHCPSEYNDDYITKIKCQKSSSVDTEAADSKQYNEDTFLRWPFYSNRTNYTYNNLYCAICNGEKIQYLHPWQTAFQCDETINITNSTQILEKLKKKCLFSKWMHSFMQFRYCRRNLIRTCLNKSEDEKKCISGPYKIRYSYNDGLVFRNEYCAKCSGYVEQTCFKSNNTNNKQLKSIATEITWSLLFDFNFFDGEYKVGFKKLPNYMKVNCDHGSFFDPVSANNF